MDSKSIVLTNYTMRAFLMIYLLVYEPVAELVYFFLTGTGLEPAATGLKVLRSAN